MKLKAAEGSAGAEYEPLEQAAGRVKDERDAEKHPKDCYDRHGVDYIRPGDVSALSFADGDLKGTGSTLVYLNEMLRVACCVKNRLRNT